ncbi:MAG TPA: Uma2 family endonuclease [Bryobacteraceae bacterium]|nr:Uma2 family endonuclease [Bryobacteraceae bacterium]
MAAVAGKLLTLDEFREKYAGEKPYFEYWDGIAIQKAIPKKLHAALQFLIATMLMELGFKVYPELEVRMSPAWEPVPDIVAHHESVPGDYVTAPVDIIIEILSPDDRMSIVLQKCERYSNLGMRTILVFDPVYEKAWIWDRAPSGLSSIQQHMFDNGAQLALPEVWSRLKQSL